MVEQKSAFGSRLALKIMLVAGEASGDRHGGALARALVTLYPEVHFDLFGSGGEQMRAAGVDTLVDARDVAVIGVVEIAQALGRFYRAYRTLLSEARKRRPDAVVLIDWPDFNLRIARSLHREGFRTAYYISPQVWAWKKYRVRTIRRFVDRMLVILPFEAEFYGNHGVEVEYVGHPLAGTVQLTTHRHSFSQQYGLNPERPIIALLPGSRRKEVHYHLPAMLDAASRLRNAKWQPPAHASAQFKQRSEASGFESAKPRPQFVVPLASTVDREQVEAIVSKSDIDVTIIEGDTYNALGHSLIAIVASGTATVEAAVLGVPMVIVYRASEINWRLIRPLIHLNTFGLVNLIAGHRVVPELIQRDVTGAGIAREVTAILSDPVRMRQIKEGLEHVRARLSSGGLEASERAARAVMGMVRNR